MAVIVLGRSHRDRDLLFWLLGLAKTNLPLLRRCGQTFCTVQTALDWPDEQTEIEDEISDQLKEDAGSRRDVAIMPQIPSGFGQNRGILFFAEDTIEVIRLFDMPFLGEGSNRHGCDVPRIEERDALRGWAHGEAALFYLRRVVDEVLHEKVSTQDGIWNAALLDPPLSVAIPYGEANGVVIGDSRHGPSVYLSGLTAIALTHD